MKRNKLLTRFFLAYCLIVLLPSIVLLGYSYGAMMKQVRSDYILSQTKLTNENVASIENKFAYIEKAAESIQFSQALINRIESKNTRDVEIVYDYVNEFQGLFANIMNYNSSLKALRIYTENAEINKLLLEFLPLEDLPKSATHLLFGGLRAKWIPSVVDGDLSLNYYTQLLDTRFSRNIGVLELSCTSSILEPAITWSREPAQYALYYEGALTYSSFENADEVPLERRDILSLENPTCIEPDVNRGILESQFYFDSIGLTVVTQTALNPSELYGGNQLLPIFGYTILFISMSSLIFFLVIYRPMRDLTRLSEHIRGSAGHILTPYAGNATDDEIGELIRSYNFLVENSNQMIERVRKSDVLRKNAQLSALQAQIDPHFFYGTLETIHMIAEADNQTLIAEIAMDFSTLMRYSLSKKTSARLSEEIAVVRQYLNIQAKRLGDRFQCEWIIETDPDQILCPRFILQPLVENVIVHSVANTRRLVHISIHIYSLGGDVRLSVEDDGPGIRPERMAHIKNLMYDQDEESQMKSARNGRGIYNIHKRLQIYYGSEYGLEVESEPFVKTVFTVTFRPTFDELLLEEEP